MDVATWPGVGCIRIADHTSVALTGHLALEGIRPSIGTVADAYDNALMETINGIYKTERIRTRIFHDRPYKTIADVEYAISGWVDWYNTHRPYSTIGHLSPATYEAAYHEALTREPQPAQERHRTWDASLSA